jgi:hypothetical protein
VKPLVTRILVTSADVSEPLRLIGGVHSYYEILANGLAPDEIDAPCRQVGELVLLEGAIRDNGFRSYLDCHDWRPQAAEDIIAAFKAIEAPEPMQIMSAIAERLNDLTAEQMREVLNGLPRRRGAQTPDLRALNEWLDEQEDLLWASLTEKVAMVVEHMRRKGVIKTASSEQQIDSEIERILARSPTHQANLRAIAERQERSRPYIQRREQVIAALGRLAGLSIYLQSYRLAKNELAWAPRCWVLSLQAADGRPNFLAQRVCYFEDGDRGVLARHADGVRLAEISIEPGSTDLVEFD